MKSLLIPAFAATLILSGCASTGQGTSPSPSASAEAIPAARPVPVPAASARKVVLNMTGPKTVVEAKDWASFKDEWRATFEDHARQAGIAFAMQDGEPRPADETGTLLSVHVNDYRMVGIGARLFLGVMTGNAYVNATVRYADLKTGKPFGEQDYNTSSSAWHGVFAKMTPQQVDAIADGVFRELTNAR